MDSAAVAGMLPEFIQVLQQELQPGSDSAYSGMVADSSGFPLQCSRLFEKQL